MNPLFVRMTSRVLIVSVLSLVVPLQSAYAGMVSTDRVDSSTQSQPERERIRTFLDREDVRKELHAQGIDANAAKMRVAALTDEEVHKVVGKLDKMPAGGEILGILFTIFIVLLITDILGFTKVFSFTRSAK
jgi:hypothetical protein